MSALDPIPVFGGGADAPGAVDVELGAAAGAESPEITPAEPGAGPREPCPTPEPAMLPIGEAFPRGEAAPAGVAPPLCAALATGDGVTGEPAPAAEAAAPAGVAPPLCAALATGDGVTGEPAPAAEAAAPA